MQAVQKNWIPRMDFCAFCVLNFVHFLPPIQAPPSPPPHTDPFPLPNVLGTLFVHWTIEIFCWFVHAEQNEITHSISINIRGSELILFFWIYLNSIIIIFLILYSVNITTWHHTLKIKYYDIQINSDCFIKVGCRDK